MVRASNRLCRLAFAAAAAVAVMRSASVGAQEPSEASLADILGLAAGEDQSTLRAAPGRDDPPMSRAEAIQWRIWNCWAGEADLPDLRPVEARVKVSLDINGRLKGSPLLLPRADGGEENDPYYTAVAEAAVRALIRCAPYYELPSETYEEWETLVLTFDPVVIGER